MNWLFFSHTVQEPSSTLHLCKSTLIYVLRATINQQALLVWTASAQAWKSASLRFLYQCDLSRGFWVGWFWARKISKVTIITWLQKRLICYQVVCYSLFKVGLQGGHSHWGLLTKRKHCNLVEKKPQLCAAAVLLEDQEGVFSSKSSRNQRRPVVHRMATWAHAPCHACKTPEKKKCCNTCNFCRNTYFWGVLQQRGFLPHHTWNTPVSW